MKFKLCFAELNLDDVLEILLVVALKFVLTKLVDKYHEKIHWNRKKKTIEVSKSSI